VKDFTSGPIAAALIAMSVPIILANLLQSAYQMIDTFWVGRLGEAAVAAVSLTFPVLFLSFSVGIGLSIAATVLVAQAAGRKDDDERDLIAAQSYLGLVAVSIVIAVVGYMFSSALMALVGAEG
jgi:Na+-driven multidrug efflux pump